MKEPRVRIAGILVENGKVLMIEQEKKGNRYWLLPGGGLDFGESFEECIKREFMEEAGIEVESEKLMFISESIAPDNSRHIVNLYFKVVKKSGDIKIGDEEILTDIKFIAADELCNYTVYPNIKSELVNYIKNGCSGETRLIESRWE